MEKIIGLLLLVGLLGTVFFFGAWNIILQPVFTDIVPGLNAHPADWADAAAIGILTMLQTLIVSVGKMLAEQFKD